MPSKPSVNSKNVEPGRPRRHLDQPESARVSFNETVQRACAFETAWRPQALLDLDRTTWRRSLSGEIVRELATEGKLAYTTRSDVDLRVRWVRLLNPTVELQKLVDDVLADWQRILDARQAEAEAAAARVKREKRHDELRRNLDIPFCRLRDRIPHRSLFRHSGEFTRHDVYLAELCRDYSGDSFAERLVCMLRAAIDDEQQLIEELTRQDIQSMLAAANLANGTL